MLSPKATRPESEGQHRITNGFEASSKSPPGPGSILSDVIRVFADHNSRANCINNGEELTAKALFSAVTGRTVSLAWVTAANNIDGPIAGPNWWECSNVIVSPYVRPMLRQNLLAIRVNLNLPFALQAGALKAKIKSPRFQQIDFQMSARNHLLSLARDVRRQLAASLLSGCNVSFLMTRNAEPNVVIHVDVLTGNASPLKPAICCAAVIANRRLAARNVHSLVKRRIGRFVAAPV
jgi:hypothetical protein